MRRFGVDESCIARRQNAAPLHALLHFQIERASRLLRSGSPLGKALKGRFGLEIRAIVLGGSRILEKIHRQEDIFSRPRLSRGERLGIAWGAFHRGFH